MLLAFIQVDFTHDYGNYLIMSLDLVPSLYLFVNYLEFALMQSKFTCKENSSWANRFKDISSRMPDSLKSQNPIPKMFAYTCIYNFYIIIINYGNILHLCYFFSAT